MTTTRGLLRVAFPAIVASSGFALQAALELGVLDEQIKRVKGSRPAIWGGELAHLLKESEPKP